MTKTCTMPNQIFLCAIVRMATAASRLTRGGPVRGRPPWVWKHLFRAQSGNDGGRHGPRLLAIQFPPINARTISPGTRVSKENPDKIPGGAGKAVPRPINSEKTANRRLTSLEVGPFWDSVDCFG